MSDIVVITDQDIGPGLAIVGGKLTATTIGSSSYSAVQLRNTDTTTNINSATTYADVPLNGTVITVGNGSTDFTASGNGVQCNFTGFVEASGQVYTTPGGSRSAYGTRFAKGGVVTGSHGNSSYSRNASGHNESGNPMSVQLISVNSGDVLTLMSRRESAAGICTMTSGGSHMLIKRVS